MDEVDSTKIEEANLYDVTMYIECQKNMLFSRYDLDIYVDGEYEDCVSHGEKCEFTIELEEGIHVIKFEKENDSDVYNTIEIEVYENVAISLNAQCKSSSIEVSIKENTQEDNDSNGQSTETTVNFEDAETFEKALKEEAEVVLTDSQTRVPESVIYLESDEPDEVETKLKNAGFTNIKKIAIYDLDFTSWWDSASLNDIETITIVENDNFDEGDIFEKDSEVVITYHAFEKDDPSIVYNKYSVSDLFDDLNSNAMRAKEEHLYEYVEIKGKISEIDGNGNYIFICATNDSLGFDFIYCGIETDELENQLLELSKGDIVTIKGKIRVVDTIYDYTMTVYTIIK